MSERGRSVQIRGAFMAALFIAVWVCIAALVRRLDPEIHAAPPAWLRPLGWLIGAAGVAIGASCVFLFLSVGRGTPAPFDPPRAFVAVGPYRYVRNPMYVGGLLALVGAGLVVRSFSILALAAVFWLLAHLMVVLREEPALERRFGESFVQYKSKVNRWLPNVPFKRKLAND